MLRKRKWDRKRLPRHVSMHKKNNRRRKKSRKQASRKVKEGGWYSERRRRQRGCLTTTSFFCLEWDSRRKNSSYNSVQCHLCSARPCMSTAMQIQREPCMCVTDSCVKPVLASVNENLSSDLYHCMLSD